MARQVLKVPDLPPEVLIQSEGDTLYAPKTHNHTGMYLPLTGGELSDSLGVNDAFGQYRIALQDLPGAIQVRAVGENYDRIAFNASTQELAFGPGNVPLDTYLVRYGPGELSTQEKFRVGTTLRVSNKFVQNSPDAGNALEWRSNGFYVRSGFSTMRDEEFTPAAAATTVTLAAAPTNLLMVARNGVVQSQGAGNFSYAGTTVTFTDAFVAGERVQVVYDLG